MYSTGSLGELTKLLASFEQDLGKSGLGGASLFPGGPGTGTEGGSNSSLFAAHSHESLLDVGQVPHVEKGVPVSRFIPCML